MRIRSISVSHFSDSNCVLTASKLFQDLFCAGNKYDVTATVPAVSWTVVGGTVCDARVKADTAGDVRSILI